MLRAADSWTAPILVVVVAAAALFKVLDDDEDDVLCFVEEDELRIVEISSSAEASMPVSYTHLTLPTICSV